MVWDNRGVNAALGIDPVLTNISVAWPNEGFVGNRLFPQVTVAKQSALYYVFNREAWSIDPGGDVRAPGTVANEIPGMKVSTQPYFAKEHSLQTPVTDEERENADSPFNPDRDGAELVTMKIMLQRELAMRDVVQTASNYPAANVVTLAGTTQFNDYVNSDPIGVFKTGIRQVHKTMFTMLNTAIIPWEVMTVLEDHPDFIERIKYSERAILTEDIIASLLGIPNIIVPGVGYNTANPGQTESLGYLWGKDILLAYVPPRAGTKIPAYAYEFVWGYGGGRPMVIDRWREEPRKSDLVRCSRRYDLKLTALDANGKSIAGYLIKNAVA